MRLADWREQLLPGRAESDDGFRQLIRKEAQLGLKVFGGVIIGATLFQTISRVFSGQAGDAPGVWVAESAVTLALGLATFLVSRLKWAASHARAIGLAAAVLLMVVLILASLYNTQYWPSAEDYIPLQATLVMLVAVAAFPLLPVQALGLGGAITVIYVVETVLVNAVLHIGSGPIRVNFLSVFMLALLCTALAVVLYRQRLVSYQSSVQALKSAEEVRELETRTILIEQTALVGRLAAALSHEMNSPLGVLKSAVDTLLLLSARQATATPENQERLVRLQADLRKSVLESTGRLTEIVARMQRFSNLDRAEVMESDVNELIRDSAALAGARMGKGAHIELDLGPLPKTYCRPAQLSVIFHGLLSNALETIQGSGTVKVKSRLRGANLQVTVEDTGQGSASSESSILFKPSLKTDGTPVVAPNWHMFGLRRMVRAHGGKMETSNISGIGTRVVVTLPCANSPHRVGERAS